MMTPNSKKYGKPIILIAALILLIPLAFFGPNLLKQAIKESFASYIREKYLVDFNAKGQASIEWGLSPQLSIHSSVLIVRGEPVVNAQKISIPLMQAITGIGKTKVALYNGTLDIDSTLNYVMNPKGDKKRSLNIEMHSIRLISDKHPSLRNVYIKAGSAEVTKKGDVKINISLSNTSIDETTASELNIKYAKQEDVFDFSYTTDGISAQVQKNKGLGKFSLTLLDAEAALNSIGKSFDAWNTRFAISEKSASPLSSSPLVIAGEINFEKERLLINKLLSNQPDIFSIDGDIAQRNGEIHSKISFSQIDARRIFRDEGEKEKSLYKVIGRLSQSFFMPYIRDMNIALELNAEKIYYSDELSTSNKIKIFTTNKKLLIEEVSGDTASGKSFFIRGIGENDDSTPKIKGEIKVTGPSSKSDKTNFRADFILAPRTVLINNISGQTNMGKLFGSSLRTISNAKRAPNTNLVLRMKNCKLQMKDSLTLLLAKLYYSDPNASGDAYFDAFKNHMWLRSLDSNWNIDARFINLQLGKIKMDRAYFTSTVKSNKLKVKSLYIDSDALKGRASGEFTVSGFKPNIKVFTNIKYFDAAKFSKLLPSAADIESKAKEIFPNLKFDPNNINLYSLNQHEISGGLNAEKIIFAPEVQLDNLEFNFSSANNLFSIKKLNCKLGDEGEISVYGKANLYQSRPEIDLFTKVKNINPKIPFKLIFGLDKINGYMSMNAKLHSKGSTKKQLARNISGAAKFLARRIEWEGFDSSQIINAVDSTSLNMQQRVNSFNKGFSGGFTVFDKVEGDFTIENSLLSVKNITFSNNRLSGAYAAYYRIYDKAISSTSRFSFIPRRTRRTLTFSMNSSGYLPSPYSVSYDTKEIASYMKE